MNWNDPNQIAIFAGWGQWAGAIGSFLAVVVAIWISLRSSKESQRQSKQTRYDAARPVVVISEGPFHSRDQQLGSEKYSKISIQADKPSWIDWSIPCHQVTLKNVGTGTAFNVISVLFGPEALNDDGKSLDASQNDHWQHKFTTMAVNDKQEGKYWVFKKEYTRLKQHLGTHSLLAPAQPLIDPSEKLIHYDLPYVCRVTTTYHDVFKRKHASIFDLDIQGNWVMKAILEDIPKDIYDLEYNDQHSQISLFKRFINRFSKSLA